MIENSLHVPTLIVLLKTQSAVGYLIWMRCTSVSHIHCSPSSWFSSTKSPAVELGCICLAFKAHFLLLHKEASVKWTVSSSQWGHKFFGGFIEPHFDEKPWKPKAIFWILRNPFLLSSRAALIPWDSGSSVLAVGRWADGGVFSFHTDQVLREATTGCSTLFPRPL